MTKNNEKKLSGENWDGYQIEHGVRNIRCTSWSGYVDFLNNLLLDYRNYVFRGHSSEVWKLESTLDRAIESIKTSAQRSKITKKHLESFKYAVRGRRGSTPVVIEDENDWWALGQHHGLATPLLDWTESPYVASYFAFSDGSVEGENIVVFALGRVAIEERVKILKKEDKDASVISFIKPMADDNPRLISQGGLFTRSPDNTLIEEWVRENFKGCSDRGRLLKITIPRSEREIAMKSLNRMNINHLSLFPDLSGAAKYCNFELEIEKY